MFRWYFVSNKSTDKRVFPEMAYLQGNWVTLEPNPECWQWHKFYFVAQLEEREKSRRFWVNEKFYLYSWHVCDIAPTVSAAFSEHKCPVTSCITDPDAGVQNFRFLEPEQRNAVRWAQIGICHLWPAHLFQFLGEGETHTCFFFIRFYLFIWQRDYKQSGRQTKREEERGSLLIREPNLRLDPGTVGSQPQRKAEA